MPILKRCYEGDEPSGGGEAGFTLMELIVVCVLIALVLTISIPTLRNNLYTDELTRTARRVLGMVNELRNLAVRQQQPYQLHFDLNGNRIWYEPDDGLEHTTDDQPGVQFPPGISLVDVRARAQNSAGLTSITLWISKQGYMDQTVVHLSDTDDRRLSLLFNPFAGSASVSEGFIDIE